VVKRLIERILALNPPHPLTSSITALQAKMNIVRPDNRLYAFGNEITRIATSRGFSKWRGLLTRS
jgi:hypothetical protein